ncbi:MAG: hypothetical protein GTO08_09500 [Deltaproteobacteria bacterium]|nr:hypothetical protein [Deltaproteobacteria bacterium]
MRNVKTIFMEFMETDKGIKGIASEKPLNERSSEDEKLEIVGDHALIVMQDLEYKVKQRWGHSIHIVLNVTCSR